MGFVKFLICVVLWIVAHKICEGYPYEFMMPLYEDNENGKPKPYDYFDFYSTVYMLVFLIVILIF